VKNPIFLYKSSKIEDLKDIYKNLMFVKEEIIKKIKSDTQNDFHSLTPH